MYNVAPKDGTVVGTMNRDIPSQTMLGLENAKFDPRLFGYLGSPEVELRVCSVMTRTGVTTVADAQKTEVFVGSQGPSIASSFIPPLVNKFAGTKFKVIDGYQSNPAVQLAMRRGEIGGACSGYFAMTQGMGEEFKTGQLNVLFSFGEKRNPILKGAPSILEYVANQEDRQILTFVNSSSELGRPFVTPPGLPADRLEALRQAFSLVMKDPDFLKEAEKAKLSVADTPGSELERIVKALYEIPKPIVDKANALILVK
jgi:tripartite-type tricarboxylate transporter receptor subunit TctC